MPKYSQSHAFLRFTLPSHNQCASDLTARVTPSHWPRKVALSPHRVTVRNPRPGLFSRLGSIFRSGCKTSVDFRHIVIGHLPMVPTPSCHCTMLEINGLFLLSCTPILLFIVSNRAICTRAAKSTNFKRLQLRLRLRSENIDSNSDSASTPA